ncbi:hypothetical protein SUGI_0517810 [Cryptomeria japonica]|uniref:eukaryotic translation initiation factor 3 subunit A-like n=1 Tax=Cryptomeria japonica TaxID=3369 RepID=UPI002408A996|nr:eukaryotic translation initiation factor 3 subunit A-like [Cryptomeria japonica]GLJ26636.1 hypothetical protein SUGI_0517810 [Cryptomeria japonica]
MGSQKRKYEDSESQENCLNITRHSSQPKSRFYHEFINSNSCSRYDISQIQLESQQVEDEEEEEEEEEEEQEEHEQDSSECTQIVCYYEELLQVEYEAAEAKLESFVKLRQQYSVDQMVEEHWSAMKEYMDDAYMDLLLLEDDIIESEGLLTLSHQHKLCQINEEKQELRKEQDLTLMRLRVVQDIKKRRERDILSVSAHLNRDAHRCRLLRNM